MGIPDERDQLRMCAQRGFQLEADRRNEDDVRLPNILERLVGQNREGAVGANGLPTRGRRPHEEPRGLGFPLEHVPQPSRIPEDFEWAERGRGVAPNGE